MVVCELTNCAAVVVRFGSVIQGPQIRPKLFEAASRCEGVFLAFALRAGGPNTARRTEIQNEHGRRPRKYRSTHEDSATSFTTFLYLITTVACVRLITMGRWHQPRTRSGGIGASLAGGPD